MCELGLNHFFVPLIQNYMHCIWATWDRRDSIEPRWEKALYSEIRTECSRLKCHVRALNGITSHVHLLIDLPATLSIAEAMKQVKGASSLFVNAQLEPNEQFKWQQEYAAFSVSRWDVNKIRDYIDRQKEHHAQSTTIESLELPPLQQLR